MAQQSLAAHHSPNFHSVFTAAIRSQIEQVCQLVDQANVEANLSLCSYESPETSWGACDGEPCGDPATVSEISGDQAFCGKHFRKISLQSELATLDVDVLAKYDAMIMQLRKVVSCG